MVQHQEKKTRKVIYFLDKNKQMLTHYIILTVNLKPFFY